MACWNKIGYFHENYRHSRDYNTLLDEMTDFGLIPLTMKCPKCNRVVPLHREDLTFMCNATCVRGHRKRQRCNVRESALTRTFSEYTVHICR